MNFIFNKRNISILLLSIIMLFASACNQEIDEHAGHDHGENEEHVEETKEVDEHAGHGHGEIDAIEVTLSKKAMELAGFEFAKIKEGKIKTTIELSGEVAYNQDRLAHIVPRFPGIVKKVYKKLGDYVKIGEVLAEIESNESLSSYKTTSLIPGRIIEKNLTLGEFVSNETTIFKIADLSTVWIDLAVYTKDMHNVKKGQKVIIEAIGSKLITTGIISYIQPIFNEETRSFIARVKLSNKKNNWRPGMFVKAKLEIKSNKKLPLIPNTAIQTVNEKLCVFIKEGNGVFRLNNIMLGKSGNNYSHIKAGLKETDSFVTNGSFEIKAKLVTSALGEHAGHGH